jgi:FtsP/CotA-like multicopper oxidase with cupredoxin domain
VRRSETVDFYQITQQRALKEFVPGLPTEVWGYNGLVPGPTIVAERNRQIVVRQINALPPVHPTRGYVPATSTHLHGAPSLPPYDGYANDLTQPGQYKDYVYNNDETSRTLWYHDHAVMHTSENVYMGLAGFYLVHDRLEDLLPLPQGRYDVPLVIRDVILGADGSLVFDDHGQDFLAGDIILVNGVAWPVMRVERRKYRFRILNGSLSRGYRLALSTGDPFTFIGTDSGLLPRPQQGQTLPIGNAERYEVVIDFAKYRIGQRVVLRNLGIPSSPEFEFTNEIMAFDVVSEPTDPTNNTVPAVLAPEDPLLRTSPSAAVRTRRLEFERQHAIGSSMASRGPTSRHPASAPCWPIPGSATLRSGNCSTRPAAGSTRSTFTWWTSGSSTGTGDRRSRMSWASRTPRSWVRTSWSGCWSASRPTRASTCCTATTSYMKIMT